MVLTVTTALQVSHCEKSKKKSENQKYSIMKEEKCLTGFWD